MSVKQTREQYYTDYITIEHAPEEDIHFLCKGSNKTRGDLLADVLEAAGQNLEAREFYYLLYEIGLIDITEAIFRWTIDIRLKSEKGLLPAQEAAEQTLEVTDYIQTYLDEDQRQSYIQKVVLYDAPQINEYLM